jgi:cell division protein FtsX
MKTYLSTCVVVLLLFFIVSCEKNEEITQTSNNNVQVQGQLFQSVKPDEYAQSSPRVKRMIDQIDAAVNALNVMSKNKDFTNYEAVISVSKDPDNKFSNSIIISASEDQSNARVGAAPDHKCTICGVSSAYQCINEIQDYMDANHKNELDIHIKRVTIKGDDCVLVTY